MTQRSLNEDCLKLISKPGPVWWTIFLIDLAILTVGLLAERNQIMFGIGVAGHTRPVTSGKLLVACSASIASEKRSAYTRSFHSGMRFPSGQPS